MTRNFGIVPGFAPGLAHCRSSPLFHRWLRAVVTPAHRGVGRRGRVRISPLTSRSLRATSH